MPNRHQRPMAPGPTSSATANPSGTSRPPTTANNQPTFVPSSGPTATRGLCASSSGATANYWSTRATGRASPMVLG